MTTRRTVKTTDVKESDGGEEMKGGEMKEQEVPCDLTNLNFEAHTREEVAELRRTLREEAEGLLDRDEVERARALVLRIVQVDFFGLAAQMECINVIFRFLRLYAREHPKGPELWETYAEIVGGVYGNILLDLGFELGFPTQALLELHQHCSDLALCETGKRSRATEYLVQALQWERESMGIYVRGTTRAKELRSQAIDLLEWAAELSPSNIYISEPLERIRRANEERIGFLDLKGRRF